MSRFSRNAAAAFALVCVGVLAAGIDRPAGAYNPCPSPATQQDCQGNPGGSDSNGGSGGGSATGGSPGSGSSPGGPGGSTSGGAGNTSASGGAGGIGDSGAPGTNTTPTPIPTAPPVGQDSVGSSSRAAGGTSVSKGAADAAAADPRLAAWAQRFKTTPDEVMSWFGTYTPEDSIGGEASSVNVHADDLVMISDHNVAMAPGDSTSTILDPAKRDNGVATADSQRVDIVMHSAAVNLGSATTDASGRFSATVSVPASLQSGKHFIIALAPKPNGGRAAFVFPVNVAERAAGAPVAVNQPRGAKHFPWLLFEAVLGTVLVVALFVVRVNSAVH